MISCVLLLLSFSSHITALGDRGLEISCSLDGTKKQGLATSEVLWLNGVGEPDLPSLIYMIGIPQGGGIEVQLSDVREEIVRDTTIEPVYSPDLYERSILDMPVPRSDVYGENRYFPDSLVEVGQPAYYRDIYTVQVKVHPVRYNPVTREAKVVRSFRLAVRFQGTPQERVVTDPSFDNIYKHMLINYEQCKSWRREPTPSLANPFATGAWYKIEVAQEGLYRIGYDEIIGIGLDPMQFDPRTMKIYTAGFDLLPANIYELFPDSLVEVPTYVEGEGDGSFDRNDYLVFYGFPASHLVADTDSVWFENGYALNNVYWFTFGGEYGKRMETVDAAWNGTAPMTTVDEIIHFEQANAEGNPTRSGINWFWESVSPGATQSASVSIPLQHPRAQGSARISVGLFILNSGLFIYQCSSDGITFFDDTLTLPVRNRMPPNYLTGEGELTSDSSLLTLTIVRPPGTTQALTAYLNSIDLTYARQTDLSAPFHALFAQGDYTVRCTDVNSTPFVLDITDMRVPKLLDNYTRDNSSITLSGTSDSLQLLYCTQQSLATPVELIPTHPGALRTQSAGCQYLFITHRNFSNSIQSLVDYRRKEYSTMVVQLDDIFNDFSYGKYDPLAIKHFLYFTTNNWTAVPTYVLLVGDATYDYKNNLGKANPPNFIPMYERGTIIAGNAGIPPNYIYEGEYVNFGAGEAMILGRITVRSNKEVQDFVDKVIAYETQPIDGMWNKRIILAGDDEYAAGDWEGPDRHCGACERIIAQVWDSLLYDFAKVYMVSYEPFPPHASGTKKKTAEEAFIRELNKGAYAGIYYGHGNMHDLSHEGLFYDIDIPRVKNSRRNFLFYFGSCTVGRFDDSDYECIGEEFVRIKDGAIGTLAATAGTQCGPNEVIGQRLFHNITELDTTLTMGESCLLARDGLWDLHYLLLGDPATRMRKITDKMVVEAMPDSVRPLQKITITTDTSQYYCKAFVRDTTHIDRFSDQTADAISGHVWRLVRYNDNPDQFVVFNYNIDGKEFYHGFWRDDTAVIFAPNVITRNLPVVKISSFMGRSSGFHDSTRIYGTPELLIDDTGPVVALYDGARLLNDSDWVDESFILTGKISDSSGINLLNSPANVPYGFYLYINQRDTVYDLRDHFMYNVNSSTTGEFSFDVVMPNRVNTVVVNVADNNLNQTLDSTILNAELYDDIKLENFLVYPNPLEGNGGLWFTFSLTNSGLVDLRLFTIAGRLIKTIDNVNCRAGYNQIFWDTRDDYGDALSNGVYLVKGVARSGNARHEVVEKFIIAR